MSQGIALPRHVAIIMDGNGRWAKRHALGVVMGHRKGVETLRGIIRHSSDIGIEVLSLYAFSTENWSRPEAEVNALMNLVCEFFRSEINELNEKGVRIRILGDVNGLTGEAKSAALAAEARTRDNTGLQLNIALNYGARDEALLAVRQIAEEVKQGGLSPDDITWAAISNHLYTRGQPDVDLLIRTSGEQRLSNFLLLQSAYAEFIFPETLWPDFTVSQYQQTLEQFASRQRRFGGRVT